MGHVEQMKCSKFDTISLFCGICVGFEYSNCNNLPVPMAARSKALVFGRSPAEIVGSNPTGGMDVCLL